MNPTFLAALFTSSLALLGLTVGKDNKVSEFRQQWIDGLRADIAEFLSSVQQLFGFREVEHYKDKEVHDDHRFKAIQRTNELNSRIRLRLDPKKPLSIELLAKMKRLRDIGNNSNLLETDLLSHVRAVEDCASALLDEAWGRVKKGELKYRACIWISSIIMALSTVAFVITGNAPLREWMAAYFGRLVR